MLLRQLHPRLELRDRDGASFPGLFAILAPQPRSAIPWTNAAACSSASFFRTGWNASGFAAADGQMGQIIKVYIDWQLSGDPAFLSLYEDRREGTG